MPKHVSGEVEGQKSSRVHILIKISTQSCMVTRGDRVKKKEEKDRRLLSFILPFFVSEKRCQTVSFYKISLVIQIMHQGVTYGYIHMGLIIMKYITELRLRLPAQAM